MAKLFKQFHHLPVWGNRPRLTIARILAWADAHHTATGKWPGTASGPVRKASFSDNWSAINTALVRGFRGLPGGQSLALLLQEHRGVEPRFSDAGRRSHARRIQKLLAERRTSNGRVSLTVEGILAWADAYHARTGRWPTSYSGRIRGVPGETWGTINKALFRGRLGLPSDSSLSRLLAEHRGTPGPRKPPPLSIDQILAWADAYQAAHGRWPVRIPVAVAEAPEESWQRIDRALRQGDRGMPGGSSLVRLLAQHRGARNRMALPPLRIDQILAWADAYHAATKKWPSRYSGPVREAPAENWSVIDAALSQRERGLPGGSSLPRLLAEHRPVRRKVLTVETIRGWAEAHREVHGLWPSATSGPVDGRPEEDWRAIDKALSQGRRGLPGGTSLTQLLGRSVDPALVGPRPNLTVEQILAWGEAHRASTGRSPTGHSGAVSGAPGEKWVNINRALQVGCRGLPSGGSLAKLFAGRAAPDGVGESDRNRLSRPA